jgi:hypothetical protein
LLSFIRTIQNVLTTIFLWCRATGTSTRHRVPKSSLATSTASHFEAAASKTACNQAASLRPMPSASRKTRALCRPRGCMGSRQYFSSLRISRIARSPFGRRMGRPEVRIVLCFAVQWQDYRRCAPWRKTANAKLVLKPPMVAHDRV